MKKRLLCTLISFVLLLGMLPCIPLVAETTDTNTEDTAYTQTLKTPNYDVTYSNASGVTFTESTHQLRMEEEMTQAPLTFSALIKVDNGESGVIVGNHFSAGDYSKSTSRLLFVIDNTGLPYLSYISGTNTITYYKATNLNVWDKGWVHLSAVFDHEQDAIYWYVNGELCDRTLSVTPTPSAPYQPLKIGGSYSFSLNSTTNTSTYNASYFKGEIGYVGLWSTLRSEAEIAAEAAALQADATAVPTTGEGLLGSWSFAGSGDILTTIYADQSGNDNNVTPYCELVNDYDPVYLEEQNIDTEIAQGDYSILLMPDIQNITRDHMGGMSEYLDDYMQWIVDNQEKYNILAYLNLGDLVQDDSGTATDEWETVQNALATTLEKAGIPGVPTRGNHDRSAYYNQYIDYDYYTSQEWFGGVYEEGYLDNSYWFIETEDVDRKYLVFSLGWSTASAANANQNGLGDPDNAAETKVGDDAALMAWVNEIIAQYPDYNVLFTAHNGLTYRGNWNANGSSLYNNILSQHNNIALSAYGHIHSPVVVGRTDPRKDGVEFPSLLVDGQGTDQYEGCKGFVAMLTFRYNSDEVMLNWYSVRDGSLYRVDSQYTITVPHINDHIHRFTEPAAEGYTCICGETSAEKTVALIGNVSYSSVESAVQAAQDGEKIVLQADSYEASLSIALNEGITIDLNGHVLTVDAVIADGAVVDSSNGKGALKASTVQLPQGNAQMALYDTAFEAYRLFDYELSLAGTMDLSAGNAITKKYGFYLHFTNENAYKLICDGAAAAKMTFSVTLSSVALPEDLVFTFNDHLLSAYAGYKLEGKNSALTITIKGLEELTDPLHISAMVASTVGVADVEKLTFRALNHDLGVEKDWPDEE